MALVVDRFDFLSREIENVVKTAFRSMKNIFAILGAAYAAHKAIAISWRCYQSCKVHGMSGLFRQNLVKTYGPWAVVTGSTHGIGKAYAQELAAQGVNIIIVSIGQEDCYNIGAWLVVTGCTGGVGSAYCEQLAMAGVNIVLISRNKNQLDQMASSLEMKFGIETCVIPVDFNKGPEVFDTIQRGIEGKEIGILVNNVGVHYDYPDFFLRVPKERLWQLINVNLAAATMMTHMILPQMVHRKRGAVIFLSSAAGKLPFPQITVYSATKIYMDYLARGLAAEYRSYGITVQSLTPYYIATRMTAFSETLSRTGTLVPSATTYVRHALATLGWTERTTGYWPHSLLLWIANLAPERIQMWSGGRLNAALRREAFRQRLRSGNQMPTCSSSSSSQLLGNPSGEEMVDRAMSMMGKERMLSLASRDTLVSSGSSDSFRTCASHQSVGPSISIDSLSSGTLVSETETLKNTSDTEDA